MNDGLKQRIVGAFVLVIIVVVVLPLLLDLEKPGPVDETTQIPARPQIDRARIEDPVRPSEIEAPKSSAEMFQMDNQRQQSAANSPQSDETDTRQSGLNENGIPRAWVIQVGSFRETDRADALRDQLLKEGYKAYSRAGQLGGSAIYRVYVGPKMDKDEALAEGRKIEKQHHVETLLLDFEP